MKIHFCDLCNESVPQADLDAGRAFVRKGRVVCAACDKAMSQAGANPDDAAAPQSPLPDAAVAGTGAETPHFAASLAASRPADPNAERTEPVRNSSAGLWMAALAMVFTAGAIFVQNGRLEEAARANRETREAALRAQRELADTVRRAQAEFPRLLREEDAQLNARMEGLRKQIDAKLAEWRDEDSKRTAEIQGLLKSLTAWRDEAGTQGEAGKRQMSEVSQRVAKGEDDARQLAERLHTLEQAAKAPPPAPAAIAKNEPAWKTLIVDLTSANAGVRWEAVDGLGQARDPQVVPALLPMLKDPDVFVRMATARVLGDLKAMSAMPGLLDALEDTEDAVREAAFVAMRSIVGKQDLKFDPLAPEAERAKRLKALREWWKKEEESGVGRG